MRYLLISEYKEMITRDQEKQNKHVSFSMNQFLVKLKGLYLVLSFLSLSFIHCLSFCQSINYLRYGWAISFFQYLGFYLGFNRFLDLGFIKK